MTLITLSPGATSDPDTCGSCKFFRRLSYCGDVNASTGSCEFRLPQKLYILFASKPYQEGDEDRTRVADTCRCDLYRPDGKRYIVQRIVGG